MRSGTFVVQAHNPRELIVPTREFSATGEHIESARQPVSGGIRKDLFLEYGGLRSSTRAAVEKAGETRAAVGKFHDGNEDIHRNTRTVLTQTEGFVVRRLGPAFEQHPVFKLDQSARLGRPLLEH